MQGRDVRYIYERGTLKQHTTQVGNDRTRRKGYLLIQVTA
jgi:hypothetical protein